MIKLIIGIYCVNFNLFYSSTHTAHTQTRTIARTFARTQNSSGRLEYTHARMYERTRVNDSPYYIKHLPDAHDDSAVPYCNILRHFPLRRTTSSVHVLDYQVMSTFNTANKDIHHFNSHILNRHNPPSVKQETH